MFKKITSAVTISALSVLALASIASASMGDSFDITGSGHADKVEAAGYANFTIANGDQSEEGSTGQAKVQPAVTDGGPSAPLNIGAGDDNDKPSVPTVSVMLNIGAGDDNDKPVATPGDFSNFTIANGDPNEEGQTAQVKVQASPVDDNDDKPTGSDETTLLNIGASDPAEQ